MKTAPQSTNLPVKRDLTLAYRLSLAVAALMAAASAAGVVMGIAGLYGADPKLATGVAEAEAGLLLPGFLGQDISNLVVDLPLLLGSIWLARRGSLFALLLWPGALFYVLYWYVIYLVGAPFSVLFLLYMPIVTLSAYATIAVVSRIDGGLTRRHSRRAQAPDAWTRRGRGPRHRACQQRAGRPCGTPGLDLRLAIEVPAVLAGGALLWLRKPLGYVSGAGLLLQYGLTPVGLAAGMALASVLAGSPLEVSTAVVLLVFGAVCFAPPAFFIRGARATGTRNVAATGV